MTDAPQSLDMTRSSRDHHQLGDQLQAWLVGKVGPTALVSSISGTSANGMSSETILFDASWEVDGATTDHHLVARIAPDLGDVPVFPEYDLGKQFEIMRVVGELTDVPVPTVYWHEPDTSHVGAEFFVMSQVAGRVPPDVMPYNFGDSWLFDEPTERQNELVTNVVDVLAQLHEIPVDHLAFLEFPDEGDTPLRRHVAHTRAWYEFACQGGLPRSPLVEAGFDWLDEHWPIDEHGNEPETVLSWGDSRIGNMMFDGVDPVAVLDWEMVGLAPRALDLAWCVYAHRVFEDIAHIFELPGMPDFLRPDEIVAQYEARSGATVGRLDWYLTYCAVQWGVVFLRTSRRQIHFGEIPEPPDIEDLFQHKPSLEAYLRGEF